MASLFLKHRRAVQNGETTVRTPDVGPAAGGSLGALRKAQLLADALTEDLKRLHEIKSIERKAEVKRSELLPKYQPYVDRLTAEDKADPLLGQYLVWLFDVADLPRAMALGRYCDAHGVGLPERFHRDLRTFMADAVLAWSEAENEAGRSPEPYFSDVLAKLAAPVPDGWDAPDALRAKYYRLHGFLLEAAGDLAGARDALTRAYALGAQVKTRLADVAKALEREDRTE
ncbi:MAG: hypothetical protein PWQ57_2014 [Desulfovibrionales bacterium]|nr:hypothetical protein [Desulfovibrionales bacterium]